MKKSRKTFLICLLLPVLVGALASLLIQGSFDTFALLNKPPLAPPAWLFPVVWTILYLLMGYASYRVLTSGAPENTIRPALTLYGIQLIVNFFWPLIFFLLQYYLLAFFWLLLLWVLIAVTGLRFYAIDKTAGYLMIPYFLWVTFAGYLNLAIALSN